MKNKKEWKIKNKKRVRKTFGKSYFFMVGSLKKNKKKKKTRRKNKKIRNSRSVPEVVYVWMYGVPVCVCVQAMQTGQMINASSDLMLKQFSLFSITMFWTNSCGYEDEEEEETRKNEIKNGKIVEKKNKKIMKER